MRMVRWKLLICMILVVSGVSAFGQTEPVSTASPSLFSLGFAPGIGLPFGRDVGVFTMLGWADVSASYRMPFMPLIFAGIDVGYSYAPLAAVTSVSIISAGLEAGLHIDLFDPLKIRIFGGGGYFFALLNDGSVPGEGNPFSSAGMSVSYGVLPSIDIGLGVSYRSFFGLYDDVSIFLGASYNFPAVHAERQPAPIKPTLLQEQGGAETPKGTGLELTIVDELKTFPVFFKYYKDHAIGKAVLRNSGKTEVKDIQVSFLVRQYMENPMVCRAPDSLAAGKEEEIELTGLFKNSILDISESTMVSANITIEYTVNGKAQKQEFTPSVRIFDRNAMTWDDDRRTAAFVTAKDPTVMKFSKNVMSMLKEKASNALNARMLAAMGIHVALCQYGLSYVIDPTTPYGEMSKNKQSVDFLQFPLQTLEYKAGDCDDLSILYCALLESVGVETAFITIPGHIFMAFSLGLSGEEARSLFQQPDDLIIANDAAWIPLEITMRDGNFLKAWQTGAKQWRENKAKGQAVLYPVHECWKTYEAVGYSSAAVAVSLPAQGALATTYGAEVSRFIDGEISQQEASLIEQVKKAQDPSKATNKLGILYAQYGLYDRAEREFARLVAKEYVPALTNMGSILLARGDLKAALGYFQRAQKKEPDNPRILLCVARANHGLENYGAAKEAFSQLKIKDPALAAKFAFLDLRGEEATRAAEQGSAKDTMVWEE